MRAEENAIIVSRFFDAINMLVQNDVIRGLKTFTDMYGLNRWNVNTLRKEPSKGFFQVAWLFFLCRDFKFSPTWFLLGQGGPLMDGWTFDDVRLIYQTRAKQMQKKN